MAAPMPLYRGVGRQWRLLQRGLQRPLARTESGSTAAAKSRLYEQVQNGWTARPRLDMEALSARQEEAERDLERRKGPLAPGDLRQLIATWKRLVEVKEEITKLEAEKAEVVKSVKKIVNGHEKTTLQSLPAYKALRERGRVVRTQINILRHEETELEEKYYLSVFKLPNRTHPDVPIGDESQARVVEVVGEKPAFDFKVKGHLQIGEDLNIIRQRSGPPEDLEGEMSAFRVLA